jgi:predicted DNA-binding protein (MmcQ/YjbR family)
MGDYSISSEETDRIVSEDELLPILENGSLMDTPLDTLERLRQLCLAHPNTTERLSHGEPTWFYKEKKTFVMYADHHHDDRLAFWCAAPEGVQAALVASAPERFFRPPYVGHRGWLGVYLDVPVDWGEIAEIVADAYRVIATPARRKTPTDSA